MNAYAIYSRSAGPQECAGLAFAHTAQEARTVGWKGIGSDITDDYLDLGANLLRNKPWLFEEADPQKLKDDIPHVIDSPKSCVVCELWGQSPIGEDNLCEECREERDDELRMKHEMEAGG